MLIAFFEVFSGLSSDSLNIIFITIAKERIVAIFSLAIYGCYAVLCQKMPKSCKSRDFLANYLRSGFLQRHFLEKCSFQIRGITVLFMLRRNLNNPVKGRNIHSSIKNTKVFYGWKSISQKCRSSKGKLVILNFTYFAFQISRLSIFLHSLFF